MTEAERVLWRALRSALPTYHWRKQVPLGPYFADFASHCSKLVIEVDGGQHATTSERDLERTRFLGSHGFRVLRFWNNGIISNSDGVIETIVRAVSQEGPIFSTNDGFRALAQGAVSLPHIIDSGAE